MFLILRRRAPLQIIYGVVSFITVLMVDLQFGNHAAHPLEGQGVLVSGLRGGQDEELVLPLVLDERLVERAFAVNDVQEVIDDPALAASPRYFRSTGLFFI